MVKRSSTPIDVTKDVLLEHIARANTPQEPKKAEPEDIVTLIMNFKPKVIVSFSPSTLSYGEVCEQYGISVKGGMLQRKAGFYRSNYNNAKKDRRKISAGEMIAACLLSNVSMQTAFHAFHAARDVHELSDYGYAAASLAYFLQDYQVRGVEHSYEELIECTIRANNKTGIKELPRPYRRHKLWKEAFAKIQSRDNE